MPARAATVPYVEPTAKERQNGDVFTCSDCSRPWLMRFRHPYQAKRCVNCGHEHRRQVRQAERRAAVVETKSKTIDFNSPDLRDAFAADQMPPEVKKQIDTHIAELVARAGMVERLEKSEVVGEPRPRLPKPKR